MVVCSREREYVRIGEPPAPQAAARRLQRVHGVRRRLVLPSVLVGIPAVMEQNPTNRLWPAVTWCSAPRRKDFVVVVGADGWSAGQRARNPLRMVAQRACRTASG